MALRISFKKSSKQAADTVAVPVGAGLKLCAAGAELDAALHGFIKRALAAQTRFKGQKGRVLVLNAPEGAGFARLVLFGTGGEADAKAGAWEAEGGSLYAAFCEAGASSVKVLADCGDDRAAFAAHLAMGMRLRSYRFDKYKKPAEEASGYPDSVVFVSDEAAKAGRADSALAAAAEGVFFARDLVNEPPNILYPASFAERIVKELRPLGVEVTVLDRKKLESLGFHALLAVGDGSAREPRAVFLRWKGGGKTIPKKKPIGFVGKGVTFDSGGINIKPSAGLEEMKMDMGGAAAVAGLFKTLALRGSKAHAVGMVGLVENMPSSKSYRPGDIISSLAGKTIEVMNTDAEGRLVLADCMTYMQRTARPRAMVDLATLTGAMMVALGSEYCGTFVNDDGLWAELDAAAREGGEKIWRMPLDEVFKKDMESKIADLRSLGGMGRYAGACTAAGFLEHFVEKGVVWAHMDIAGTAWIKADRPVCPKPATGFGVRTLDRLVAAHYE